MKLSNQLERLMISALTLRVAVALVASTALTAVVAAPLALQALDNGVAPVEVLAEGQDPPGTGPDTSASAEDEENGQVAVGGETPEATLPDVTGNEAGQTTGGTLDSTDSPTDTADDPPTTSDPSPTVTAPPELPTTEIPTTEVPPSPPTSAPADPPVTAVVPTVPTTTSPTPRPTIDRSTPTASVPTSPPTSAGPTSTGPTSTSTPKSTSTEPSVGPSTTEKTTTTEQGDPTAAPSSTTTDGTTTTDPADPDPGRVGIPDEILWSTVPEGVGEFALDGAELTETVYLHFGRSRDILEVSTWIDQDLGAVDDLRPFVIRLAIDPADAGDHQLRAELRLADGEVVVLEADFNVPEDDVEDE